MARGLRVVGGIAGGRRLVAPKGSARPTTDRVKEALFNVLGTRVVDAAVLDLYAGSGALGIEALSRGARSAVFVDNDHASVDAIVSNILNAGFVDDSRVMRVSVARFLASVVRQGTNTPESFDLVFLDPPYDTPTAEIEAVLGALVASGCLEPGCRFVVERARASESPALPPGWETGFQRVYGDTLLTVVTS